MFPEGVGSSCGSEVHLKEFDAVAAVLRPLCPTTPVDAEGFIKISIPLTHGTPVSLRPNVELVVADCSKFLLVRSPAEPESAPISTSLVYGRDNVPFEGSCVVRLLVVRCSSEDVVELSQRVLNFNEFWSMDQTICPSRALFPLRLCNRLSSLLTVLSSRE